MIKISKDSKVYVACPYKLTSGGPETLHQLVDKLRNNNVNAYIYYFNANKLLNKNLIADKFKKYNIEYVTKVEDDSKNIIIIPEMNTELLYKFKNIQKGIWWLSFDFYVRNIIKNRTKFALEKRRLPQILRPLMVVYFIIKNKGYKQLDFHKDENLNNYFHLYNCEYIKQILLSNNVKEERLVYLCGPIRESFLTNERAKLKKENIVLYNPAKGLEFTAKIIKNMNVINPNIKFIPLKDMTPNEMVENLKKAKLYIDFGFFPGPERIPREAVSCYCNIITSDIGSAKNDIDVPIPRRFKFQPIDENINIICEEIINQVNNYDDYIQYYDEYRKKVKEQYVIFDRNIKTLFVE